MKSGLYFINRKGMDENVARLIEPDLEKPLNGPAVLIHEGGTTFADIELVNVEGYEVRGLRLVTKLLREHNLTPEDLHELVRNVAFAAELMRKKEPQKAQSAPTRYTHYDHDMARYVVPCYEKLDGSRITFHVKTGEIETIDNTRGQHLTVGRRPDIVWGEVIDRLAELENKEEAER